jgi:PKD repeat protein
MEGHQIRPMVAGGLVVVACAMVLLAGGPWTSGPADVAASPVPPASSHSTEISARPAGTSAGSNWTPVTVHHAPSPRWLAPTAYDPATQSILLGGGADPSSLGAQTWSLLDGNWTNITGTSGTNPSNLSAMTYDPALGVVVGLGSYGNHSTTWEFSAGTWTNVTAPGGPSGRDRVMMTYDAGASAVLLFGGEGSTSGAPLSDTWEFGESGWVNVTRTLAPPARARGSLAWDPELHASVLFGGFAYYGQPDFNDTWEFQNGTWSELSFPTTPSGRDGAPLVYDPLAGALMMFGGFYTDSSFGQGVDGDTWFFNGSWNLVTTPAAPSPRALSSAAYDPAMNAIYLFGGYGYPEPLNDSWAFYQNLSTPLIETPVAEVALGALVDFNATFSGGLPPFNVSWSFGDQTVAYGGAVSHTYSAEGNYTVTVSVRDSEPAQVTSSIFFYVHAAALALGPILTSVPEGTVGHLVDFSAAISGGVGSYTWSWAFGDGATTNVSTPTHTYFDAGSRNVTVQVRDAGGLSVSGGLEFPVSPYPVVVSATASASSLSAGGIANFSATATGGTAPYNLTWTFGDGTLGYGAAPSHTYSANGTYTVEVTARDVFGLLANTTLTVVAAAHFVSPRTTTIYHNATTTTTAVPSWVLPAVGGAVLVAVGAAAAAVYFWRAARRPPTPPSGGS